MKIVFIDTEYTGEHALTTLVSVGLVTLEENELYLTLNDYDRDQVTDWLKENVLPLIDEPGSVSRKEACHRIAQFLESYSQGELVSLVSAGKVTDITLFFQLWHTFQPEKKYFHFLHGLPSYLNHRAHFDLDTLFFAAGVDPNIDREDFVAGPDKQKRHHALHDAQVVRQAFLKLLESQRMPNLTLRRIK